MTFSELVTEWEYRRSETLALLCGEREPTVTQVHLAEQDADKWVMDYFTEQRLQGQKDLRL
jgi:hypothetical protein